MIKWFTLIFVFFQSLTSHADVTGQIDVALLQKLLKEQALCSTVSSARLCRGLPWVLRSNEGVLEFGASAFVFLQEPPGGSDITKWSARFSSDKKLEYSSFFAVAQPYFTGAMSRTSFGSVYVIQVSGSNSLRMQSVMLIGSAALNNFVQQQYTEITTELSASTVEWIPPETFKPEYEFKAIVQ